MINSLNILVKVELLTPAYTFRQLITAHTFVVSCDLGPISVSSSSDMEPGIISDGYILEMPQCVSVL